VADDIKHLRAAHDDIIARLSNACGHPCNLCRRENAYVVGEDAAELIGHLQYMAEELLTKIGRLQGLGDVMAYRYQHFGPSTEMRDAVAAWGEARRG
jgi:hypothetical protein